jgi:hydroxyethylthiazole kinase-like uncharacterized protein yjeF
VRKVKLVDVAQMRELEAVAERLGLPGPALMEIAGRVVADALHELFGPFGGQRVVVLVGPGNNGGDGLVAARWLADRGARVAVLAVARRPGDDAKVDLLRERGISPVTIDDSWQGEAVESALAGSRLVVDALLGIGRVRPIQGAMARVLAAAGGTGVPIVAVDVPSGLDADTGRADPATPWCAVTLALGGVKRGMLLADGPERCGFIVPLPIGIPRGASSSLSLDVLDGPLLRALLPPRSAVGHKGSFGRALVVAGSSRYLGAPMLAALGAARAGAGLVTLAAPTGVADAVAGRLPEITFLPLPGPATHLNREALEPLRRAVADYDALVVGPGLGRDPETAELLTAMMADNALADGPGWVVDADALTLLSREREWWRRLPKESVLTPHPGEMARLRGEDRIGDDRITIAVQSAASWGTAVALKGAYTVVVHPDGRGAVSLAANPALATAGTGDVLAGTVAGLLAQGAEPFDAARVGVGLHAAAGELVRRQRGPGGGLAGDVAELLPVAAARVRAGWDPWGVAATRDLLATGW